MNIYNPSITELDEVYTYYENTEIGLIPPLGVQVGWEHRHVEWPESIEEVEESTEFQRLEWARFLPPANLPRQHDIIDEIHRTGWFHMDSIINCEVPQTPKQQLQHDGEYEKDDAEPIEGLSHDDLTRLL